VPVLKKVKWEVFAQGIAIQRLSTTDAYINAGYKKAGAASNAAVLRRNHSISFRIDELQNQVVAQVVKQEITERNARVSALQDRWQRMRRIIDERAAEPIMATVAGGRTGLLAHTKKAIGAEVYDLFEIDVAMLREMRGIEQQAAQEMGQWQERSQVAQVWDGRLESLTPQQRDQVLKDLAEAEFPGDPDAVAKALAVVKDLSVQ